MNNQDQISLMATEAIENVLISGEIADIKSSLTDFFHDWLVSDNDPDLEERRHKLFHYQVLQGILTEAQQIRDIRDADMPLS